MVLPIHHRHTAQKRQRTIDRPPRPRPRRLEGAEAHPRRLSSSIPTRSGTRRGSHLALQRRTALSGPRHRSWRRVSSARRQPASSARAGGFDLPVVVLGTEGCTASGASTWTPVFRAKGGATHSGETRRQDLLALLLWRGWPHSLRSPWERSTFGMAATRPRDGHIVMKEIVSLKTLRSTS